MAIFRFTTFVICVISSCALIGQTTCLVCNDQSFISLDETGKGQLTPAHIIEVDTVGCRLQVSILDANGEVIIPFVDTAKVSCLMLGQNLVEVRNVDNGNLCWGTVTVEDPLGVCTTSTSDSFEDKIYYSNGVLYMNSRDSYTEVIIHNSIGQKLHTIRPPTSTQSIDLTFLPRHRDFLVKIVSNDRQEALRIFSR